MGKIIPLARDPHILRHPVDIIDVLLIGHVEFLLGLEAFLFKIKGLAEFCRL